MHSTSIGLYITVCISNHYFKRLSILECHRSSPLYAVVIVLIVRLLPLFVCLGCLGKVFLTSVIALAAYNLHGTVSLLYCWDIPNKYSSFVRSHHRPIADEL